MQASTKTFGTNSSVATTNEMDQFDVLWQGTRDLVYTAPTNVSFELTPVVSVPTKPNDVKDSGTSKPDLRKFVVKYSFATNAFPSAVAEREATFSVLGTKVNQFNEVFFQARRATWSQYPRLASLLAVCFPDLDTTDLRLSVASLELTRTEKMESALLEANAKFVEWINSSSTQEKENSAIVAKYSYKNEDTSPHMLSRSLKSKPDEAEKAALVDFSYAQFD